jgi:type I restriction-modification system specificity subunit
MEYTKIKNINEYVSESINPMKTPDTVFEMYSVPIYETGHPEYLRGSEIASNKTIVRKNDVLLCKINPRINRVWVVGDESQYQNIASSEWIVIRTSEYNPEFLAWYFRNPKFQKLMMSEVTGIGGSLTRAQPKAVAEYPVPVLPRLEQDAIAEVLNRVNDIINGRKRELQILDDLVKARFVELFGDPIINPRGFEKVPLSKLAEIKIGPFGSLLHKEDYIQAGHALVNPSHIIDGKISIDSKLTVSEEKFNELCAYHLRVGDVVMGRRGEMGRCAVVTENGLLCGTGSLLIRTNGEVTADYIQKIISFPSFKKTIEEMAVGQTMPNLNVPIVSRFQIIKPPFEVQKAYYDFVTQTDKSKAVIQKALDEAQLLFDSLMQKYFQ